MIKKGMVSLLSLLLALMFTACSSNGKADSKPAATSAASVSSKKIELRMTWWGSQTRHDLTMKALKLFEQKHPNITIKPEYSGWDGYFDKLATQVAGANAPDLIQMDYAFLTDYAKRGALLDLSPYVQKELNTADHDKSMIAAGTIDNKLYALTMGVNAPGVIYNSSVLKDLGIAEPQESWTWTDFADMATRIAKAKGKGYFGSMDIANVLNMYELFIRQSGGSLFKDGQLGATKDSLSEWYKMWGDLRKSGSVPTPEITAATTNAIETRPITLGTAAMDFAWSNQTGTFQKVLKNQNDKLKIQVIPHLAGEKKIGEYLKPSMFISGYSKTSNPKEVAMVIDFLINDPDASKILGAERGVPINAQIRQQLKTSLSENDQMIFDFIDTVSKHSSDIDPPYPQGFTEIDKNFTVSGQKISFGQGSVDDVVNQFITNSNQILSKIK
jgi:multiple sugar transport system substrate-binding protein